MPESSQKPARIEKILRDHFPKFIILFAGLGAFLMLKSRLSLSPMPAPENPLIATAAVQSIDISKAAEQSKKSELEPITNFSLPNSFAPVETLEDFGAQRVEELSVPDEALARFLSMEEGVKDGVEDVSPQVSMKSSQMTVAKRLTKVKRNRTQRQVTPIEPTISLDGFWGAWDEGEVAGAVDESSPLSIVIRETLNEVALTGSYDENRLQSLLQLGSQVFTVLQERGVPFQLRTAIGVVAPNNYDEEIQFVAALRAEEGRLLVDPVPAEQPITDDPIATKHVPEIVFAPGPSRAMDNSPPLDAQKELAAISADEPSVDLPMEEVFDSETKRPVLASASPSAASPEIVSDFSERPDVSGISISGPVLVLPKANLVTAPRAPMTTHSLERRATGAGVISQPKGNQTTSTPPDELSPDTPNSPADEVPPDTDKSPRSGKIFGSIELDAAAAEWLESKKGHVEIYLHARDSQDPQDTLFVDSHYPDLTFEIESAHLKFKYQLMAAVYLPDSSTAFASIPYEKTIGPDFRERIRFRINRQQINGQRSEKPRKGSVPLTLTIFEGLSGNYRQPVPVAGATVSIVGFNGAEFVSGSDGSVRIARVPIHSELLLRVSAPKYMPTEHVVPIFNTAGYAPIYLLPDEKVSDVSRYFVQSAQQPGKGVLIGRVFDAVTRTPKAQERFSLSFRKGGPLYFGALPDPNQRETGTQGLFGFFNLPSLYRVLSRDASQYGLLTNIRPGHGYYVEWGRGGRKPFRGKIEDPFNRRPLHAKVSWLEHPESVVETNPGNRFQFDAVDLPPGAVTLETEIDGYPKTWHTLPWSSRERADVRTLYVLESELIRESLKSFARAGDQPGLGSLVGGASVRFMRKTACTRVRLLSTEGSVVEADSGPYYFSKKRSLKDPICLTTKEPGFSFVGLRPGDYLLQYLQERGQDHGKERGQENGRILRSRLVRIGMNRVSVAVE